MNPALRNGRRNGFIRLIFDMVTEYSAYTSFPGRETEFYFRNVASFREIVKREKENGYFIHIEEYFIHKIIIDEIHTFGYCSFHG